MITIAPPPVPALAFFQNVAFGALAAAGLGPVGSDAANMAVGANPIKDGALIKALESKARGGRGHAGKCFI